MESVSKPLLRRPVRNAYNDGGHLDKGASFHLMTGWKIRKLTGFRRRYVAGDRYESTIISTIINIVYIAAEERDSEDLRKGNGK